jgi:hypothetical protein
MGGRRFLPRPNPVQYGLVVHRRGDGARRELMRPPNGVHFARPRGLAGGLCSREVPIDRFGHRAVRRELQHRPPSPSGLGALRRHGRAICTQLTFERSLRLYALTEEPMFLVVAARGAQAPPWVDGQSPRPVGAVRRSLSCSLSHFFRRMGCTRLVQVAASPDSMVQVVVLPAFVAVGPIAQASPEPSRVGPISSRKGPPKARLRSRMHAPSQGAADGLHPNFVIRSPEAFFGGRLFGRDG